MYESFIPYSYGMCCNSINRLYVFFNTPRENEPLEGPNANSNIIPKTELKQPEVGAMTRPETGLSTFIGQGVQAVVKQYGEPARKEPSSFGYDWWVYNTSAATFFYGRGSK